MEEFIFNPNVIWMSPPRPTEENEAADMFQAIPLHCPDDSVESGRLVCFRGENEFTLKIGGTSYDVSTHFTDKGKESVLEQFKRLLLSQKLI